MRGCWNRQTGTFEVRVSFDVWVRPPSLAPYGEVAEWLKALVLKTSEGNTSVGSNPTLPANPQYSCVNKQLIRTISDGKDMGKGAEARLYLVCVSNWCRCQPLNGCTCTLSIVGIMQWPYKPKRLGSSPRGCTKATAVA